MTIHQNVPRIIQIYQLNSISNCTSCLRTIPCLLLLLITRYKKNQSIYLRDKNLSCLIMCPCCHYSVRSTHVVL